MKIRFLRGTTLAGGTPVNPGEVHEVSPEDGHRFVNVWRDAELVTEAPKVVEAKAPTTEAPASEAPKEEPNTRKKRI